MVMYWITPKYCVTMKKQNSNKGKAQQPWGVIRLGGFRAEFPQPRIPRLLGSDRNLGSRNSVYPNNVMLDVPIITTKSSIAAGVLAASIPLDLTKIQAFSSRFASLFQEYAIVGASLEVRMNNTINNAGVLAAFIDEDSSAAPGPTDALNRPRLDVLVAQQFQPGSYRLNWTPRDILDLDYVDCATTFTPAWLKLYTDVGNFGTTATTTGDVLVTGTLALCFRGYN